LRWVFFVVIVAVVVVYDDDEGVVVVAVVVVVVGWMMAPQSGRHLLRLDGGQVGRGGETAPLAALHAQVGGHVAIVVVVVEAAASAAAALLLLLLVEVDAAGRRLGVEHGVVGVAAVGRRVALRRRGVGAVGAFGRRGSRRRRRRRRRR